MESQVFGGATSAVIPIRIIMTMVLMINVRSTIEISMGGVGVRGAGDLLKRMAVVMMVNIQKMQSAGRSSARKRLKSSVLATVNVPQIRVAARNDARTPWAVAFRYMRSHNKKKASNGKRDNMISLNIVILLKSGTIIASRPGFANDQGGS